MMHPRGWAALPTIAVISLALSANALAVDQNHPRVGDSNGVARDSAQSSNETLADWFSLTNRKGPIDIRSHGLEFFHDENRIHYLGNVVVTQGDTTIESDRLTVLYENEPSNHAASPGSGANPSSRQRLKRITAEGRVRIASGDRRATSNKAIFNEQQRTVVLRGNVVLREGGSQVTGDEVTVFLDEKRSVVKGGKGKHRAHMLLIPD